MGLVSAAAAQGGSPPALASLIRFPDVKLGGEFVVTQGIERPLSIRYGKDIAPTTFRATLNGKVVTHLFNPKTASGGEAVKLPLVPGDNLLRIEVNSREAAQNPKSALLPQEHILKVKVVRMATGTLSSSRTFSSSKESDASLERLKEQFDMQ